MKPGDIRTPVAEAEPAIERLRRRDGYPRQPGYRSDRVASPQHRARLHIDATNHPRPFRSE